MDYSEGYLTVERELDCGYEVVRVKLPALICVLQDDFEPVRPSIKGVIKSYRSDIKVLGHSEIGINAEDVGLKGSPTYVNKAFRASKRESNCVFLDNIEALSNVINNEGVL